MTPKTEKHKNFMKTVGICAVGFVGSIVSPTLATIALGLTAAYTYSKSSRDQKNFIKLTLAVAASAFVSPSLIGVAAVGALGYALYSMAEDKKKAYSISTPYDVQLVEKAKKTLSMKR